MGKRQDLTGKRFGRLVAIHFHCKIGNMRMWFCQCNCGGHSIVSVGQLNSGKTKSCGCLRTETTIKRSTKHGYSNGSKPHPLYWVWSSMCQRCTNTNNKRFKDYGARGITVQKNWLNDPGKFINWCLNNNWKPGLTIERINNDSGYNSQNCKFITPAEQARNTRKTIFLIFNHENKSLQEWAKLKNINPKVLHDRIYKCKWSIKKALTTPLMSQNINIRRARKR